MQDMHAARDTRQATLLFTQQTLSFFTVFPFSMPQWGGSSSHCMSE